MSTILSTTYVCDICRHRKEGPNNNLPENWIELKLDKADEVFGSTVHLCSSCTNHVLHMVEESSKKAATK